MANQWRKRKKRLKSMKYFRFWSSRGRVSWHVTRKRLKYFLEDCHAITVLGISCTVIVIAVITKTGRISRKKKRWHIRRIKVRNKAKQRYLFLTDLGSKIFVLVKDESFIFFREWLSLQETKEYFISWQYLKYKEICRVESFSNPWRNTWITDWIMPLHSHLWNPWPRKFLLVESKNPELRNPESS